MSFLFRSVGSSLNNLLTAQWSRAPLHSVRFRSMREEHRGGVRKEGDPAMDGTSGANDIIPVSTANVDRRFPTSETLKQVFFGVPFAELPMVYIKATKNNTLIHFKNITYTSCRLEGFKNARKKTTIAGQTTGMAAGQRLLRRGINAVRVLVKGIGPGRMASVKGIASAGVNVISITDRTLIKELGPRPRKIRRI